MLAAPGSPPKLYGRKVRRSLGLFLLRGRGVCNELLRVRITRRGDAYVILTSLQLHESFHASGEFHWRFGNRFKTYPLCGALDLPMAIRFYIVFNRPPCFCIRCDNLRLNYDEIKYGLRLLLRFLPLEYSDADIEKTAHVLKDRGFVRYTLIPHHYLKGNSFSTLPIMGWEPKRHINAVRKMLEGTKFEKDVITFEEAITRIKYKRGSFLP